MTDGPWGDFMSQLCIILHHLNTFNHMTILKGKNDSIMIAIMKKFPEINIWLLELEEHSYREKN